MGKLGLENAVLGSTYCSGELDKDVAGGWRVVPPLYQRNGIRAAPVPQGTVQREGPGKGRHSPPGESLGEWERRIQGDHQRVIKGLRRRRLGDRRCQEVRQRRLNSSS